MKLVLLLVAAVVGGNAALAAAAENTPPSPCRPAHLECAESRRETAVPTVRDQIRERRERGTERPRLDRPDVAEPSFGDPGFIIVDPSAAIGR